MAKRALMLLAVDPDLRGVLIAQESGSGKSTLGRSFASLLDCQTVVLPLNVTEDRLLGALDLERTLATGSRELSTGLLARANGGVLFADDVNLLDANMAAHIAHALSLREVCVEREGLSAVQPADFMLVGAYNPAEGGVSALLRDRVGLIAGSSDQSTGEEKAEIVSRALRWDKDAASVVEDFATRTAELQAAIELARELLPRVRFSGRQIRQLALTALRLGVEGNRADVFALKAARASAALAGRDEVADDDIIAAIQLVLAPRATAIPEAVTPERADSSGGAQSDHQEGEDAEGCLDFAGIEDLMIRAIDVAVPDDVLSVAHRGSRKARSGKRVKSAGSTRGRYVRSSIHQTSQPRVAADATLRAAAPFQLKRGERPAGRARITIEPRDLRFKVLKHRAGMLFIFAVDASGSMAVNRMAQAKGALTRLLQQAYLHRDKVALISFRGESAEVLLSPTRSIELARRLADVLPAGGGTPLSAGVAKAIELAWVARSQGMPQAMLVLLTDGRANVSLAQARTPTDELERLGRVLASEGIESVVIDTKLRFVSAGEAQSLARMLGARYVYLPNSDQRSIYEALRTVITRSTVLDA